MKPKNEVPPGWDEQRVHELVTHYESQAEEEAVAEDEAAFGDRSSAGLDLEDAVRDLVRRRASGAGVAAELPDDLRLGSGGAGLDSIALVELLLDCEQRFAVPVPVELLDGAPLTVGRLVAGVRAAMLRAGG